MYRSDAPWSYLGTSLIRKAQRVRNPATIYASGPPRGPVYHGKTGEPPELTSSQPGPAAVLRAENAALIRDRPIELTDQQADFEPLPDEDLLG